MTKAACEVAATHAPMKILSLVFGATLPANPNLSKGRA
eukprot:CAMPEP_0175172332 /NCGR_PEP_ID=MMETSP0087-20121206/31362_1 /TAXON_ID=136419 /ORGANISM="Unknown Unknown, Strain D1" /LENGTH=37 /DNA_ID= /DNA_START= /DNA_END= /DNA_ORIENTATION=